MTKLEKYLYQLRRIEEHREKAAEQEIRKIYKEVLREVNGYIGNIYATYSEDDMLDYSMLAKAGMDARFLEEVEGRINGISPRVASMINDTVEQTYEACYDGMRNAVTKAAGNRELLQQAFSTVTAVTPDVIRQAVNNPIAGLTLKDTLEKHRKDIIYDIKKNIGVGLSNGDRYSTMAKRIAESIDGDYTKAVRIVRTETHRVRESGYNDAATDINEALKNGSSGYVMAKTWRTMDDERVRPAKAKGKARQYNHVKMDGVTIPQDAMFEFSDGTKTLCPSKSGVAGHDINCRCYLSYDLVLASELMKVQNGVKSMEEAVKVEEPQETFTVRTFDGVKTTKELNAKAQEEFARYGVTVDFSGLDVDTAKRQANALLQLTSEYKTQLVEVKTTGSTRYLGNVDRTGNTYKELTTAKMQISKKYGSKKEMWLEEVEKGVKKGDTPIIDVANYDIYPIVHEFAHTLDNDYINTFYDYGNTDFWREIEALKVAYKNAYARDKTLTLGKYATTNNDEFIAECFAEALLSSNPSKYSLKTLAVINKYFKK